MNHGKLVLKNLVINTVVGLLSEPVVGKVARSRNRFILLLNDRLQEVKEAHMALLKKYGDLSDKGELQIDEENGTYKMKDKDAFEKEFDALMEQVLEIPCRAEQLVDFQCVHNMLANLDTKLTVAQTTIYEEIMSAFEAWSNAISHE